MSDSKKRRILTATALILGATALIFALCYTVLWAKYEFHADCSDTLYWANATVESGRLISDEYTYSALLPFGGQIVMVPMIWLFGFSMTAHVAGMAIFVLLFFAALWLLFRTLEFSIPMSAVSVFVSVSVFSMSVKLREIFFGHVIYYSLGIFIFALTISLSVRFFDAYVKNGSKNPKTVAFGVMLGIFTVLSATDGAQIIVIGILPVIFALAVLLVLEAKSDTKTENRAGMVMLGITAAGTLCGTVLLKILAGDVSAGYADGYSTYCGTDEIAGNIEKLPGQFFTLLGFSASGRDPMFSFDSVLNIVRVAFGVLLLVLPVVAFFLWKTNSRGTKIVLLGHLFVTAFILYGYVFGRLSAANWRMIPTVGTALISSLAAIFEFFKLKNSAARVGILCLALLAATSVTSVCNLCDSVDDGGSSKYLYEISEYLEENGLTYGYADYWESQALSVISGPDVKVRSMRFDSSTDEPVPYYYQSSRYWFTEQKGTDKYFVLLDAADYAIFSRSDRFFILSESLLYEDEIGNFAIAVFDTNPIEE